MAFDRFRDENIVAQRAELRRRDGFDPCPGDPGLEIGGLLDVQAARPHVFVRKIHRRYGGNPTISTFSKPANDLAVSEVFSLFGASEFAASVGLLLDTHVTIDFGRLGVTRVDDVQIELKRFLKCYRAWCRESYIPPLWLSAVEMSVRGDCHAHVALFVPGDLNGHRAFSERRRFRAWAREYTDRNFGKHIPRAIKVSGGHKMSIITHWIVTTYLAKGV